MRILTTTDTVGGVWSFTKELSRELLEKEWAVALVSLGRMPSEAQQAWVDEQRSRWGSRFRFEALDVPLEWMAENGRAFSDAAPALLRVADEFDAELILTSQYCFGALECDVPRVVVAHSDVLSWGEACRPGGLGHSEWLATYRDLVTAGLRGADAVVTPTRWMLDALAANFELPEEKCVIANGRRLTGTGEDARRRLQAVTAGRLWDEAKNLRLLEKVDSPVPLLIAGETEYESARLDLSGNDVTALGVLDEPELLKVFRESSIYICTSCYEPFGLAPLEAALCGCAVIANDIPSLHEVWGDAALYFSGPESLSSWLWRLSDHPWLLHEAQQSAMSRAQEFTAERMAESYIELFRAVSKHSLIGHHVA